jgi:hypothetical protein
VKLRMGEADRARYGGPPLLDWDPDVLTVAEAEAFEANLGVEAREYGGRKGWLATAGEPATRWALWLSLCRVGVEIAWGEFTPDVSEAHALRPPATAAPAEEPGVVHPSRALRLRVEEYTPALMHFYHLRWDDIPRLPLGLFGRLVDGLPKAG